MIKTVSNRRNRGGIMKQHIYGASILLVFIFVYAPSVQAQNQEVGGYTVFLGGSDEEGKWNEQKV